jgi:hypothetical protein
LFKLFSTTINTGLDQNQTIVSHLLLTRWEGTENDPWKLLPGLDKRRTALSDHLHELFEGWTVDYLFIKGEYTTLFEHFELLGTLAYITLSNEKASFQAAIQNPGRDFVWSPIGRAAWDDRTSRTVLEDWKGDLQPLLLKAGFAHGDQDYLPLALRVLTAYPAGSLGNGWQGMAPSDASAPYWPCKLPLGAANSGWPIWLVFHLDFSEAQARREFNVAEV